MSRSNPQSKTFQATMAKWEKTFRTFLDSEDFKTFLVWECCHTRQWKYNNQALRLQLLPKGVWKYPCDHSWKEGNECLIVLSTVSEHCKQMEKIGETEDFDDILKSNPERAKEVAERLFEEQKEYLVESAWGTFQYIRTTGFM